MNESRVKKSLLNARISFIFYFITLVMTFFSRKIFLDTLGPEFIGLSGTLNNILSMMSLAELGIGTSISFHLYKPIRDENKEEICKLISLFGWFYRIVGSLIFVVAVIVSLFFPIMFKETTISLPLIYFVFFSFLSSSLIGYFINFRQVLLAADQKTYLISAYMQTATVVKTLVQMACCYYFTNYYLWTIIELIFSVIGCIILNWKIEQTYPWLVTNVKDGLKLYREYPSIITSTKQIFIHKIKDFILRQSDQILIFAFVSLKTVAYYGNYSMLFVRISALFTSVMSGAEAGVGNLVAEGDQKKIDKVFWELMASRYFVAGIIAVGLYFVYSPFMTVWLGDEYVLSPFVTILICVNIFFTMVRTSVDTFNHAYGQYADVWAAWTEGGVNLAVTFIVASQIGLAGILLGKIISVFFLVILWKPYYLFRDGFHLPYWHFWKNTGVYYILLFVAIAVCKVADGCKPMDPYASWRGFVAYGVYIGCIFTFVYFILLYFFTVGMKDFTLRLVKLIKKR